MDPEAENVNKYDLSSIRAFACVGEILESSIVDYIQNKIKKPVMDIFGQTEGTTLCTYSGPLQYPFIKGYYRTNDLGYFDKHGYLYVVSRIDDTINIGGSVVYCKSYEDVIIKNDKLLDCSVAHIQDELLGKMPCAFVILKDQFKNEFENDKKSFTNLLKNEINSNSNEDNFMEFGGLKHLIIVNKLPMTRSNKKIRNILSKIFDDKEFEIPLSISNNEIISDLKNEINDFKLNLI
ncbi:hypothetical protein ACTFIY_008536 [Dictyostelium cf. discoideum]